MTRDERQKQSLNAWTVQGYQGCLQAVTGFGKTRIAMMGLRGLKKKGLINTATVTVPTIVLKEQWERELESFDVADFTTVVVNNTAAMRPKDFACDLLICDEVHTVPTNTRDVILQITHKYFLGLSATIERQDGRHEEILEKYPVFDVIRFDECIENEWISPYKVYNVPVAMPDDLMKQYGVANNQFRGIAAKLSVHDRNTMRVANLWLATGDAKQKQLGALYYKFMNARKSLCINNPNKVEIVKNIVSLCSDRYGIIFSQSISFADEITKSIGEEAVTFHSKLSKKNAKELLNDFKDPDSSTRIISSVQALDSGFDFVDLSLAIVAAGFSSKLTNVQRTGRTVRAKEGKKAIIINLYSENTQEMRWLEERQKEDKNVTYLKSPEELYEICSRISTKKIVEPKRASIPTTVAGESL